jgi:aspartyl-tRNA(Asn)/glutamyl-tRNA(Gln) amidotransferase subunit A
VAADGGRGALSGLVIGIPDEYDVAELSPAVRAAWYRMADWMAREGGARVVRVSLPHTRLALPAYYILAPAEAMSNLSRYDGVRYGHAQAREEMEQALKQEAGTGAAPVRLPLDAGPPAQGLREYYTTNRSTAFGPEVQRRILVGSFVLSSRAVEGFYARAQRIRRAISEDFSALFRPSPSSSSSSSSAATPDRVDVLLTPTAMGSALSFASIASDKATSPVSAYLNDLLTIPANLAGLPALSVPGGYDNEVSTKDGSNSSAAPLPLGLQLLGDYHSEGKLLDVAAWMQHKLRAEGVAPFELLQQRPQLRELLQTELKQ